MNPFVKSYLSYTRGESRFSPWLLLKPAGWLGIAVVKARRALYDHGLYSSEETLLPVISIGNLTTGGTNKTPFVEYVAKRLSDYGLHPGIVSRGYGGHASEPIVFTSGESRRELVGDEPLLLSQHLPNVPIAVSTDRIADVRALRAYGADIAVVDDAFQHRKLARSLDIVLVDATCPFGNGSPLPDGILRELPSSLSRAHIVVITKTDQACPEALKRLKEQLLRWTPEERVFTSRLRRPQWLRWEGGQLQTVAEEFPSNMKLAAFSGIGNPYSFHATVVASGAQIVTHAEFKDHHHYVADELRALECHARSLGADALCCTEKDIFNLPEGYASDMPLFVPRISAEIDDEPRFWHIAADQLRPRLIVASNGYGEDAMGVRLALKLKQRFPIAEVCAFPLVGLGDPYSKNDIGIVSPIADTVTGGIIKYHFKDFLTEIKAGLLGHVSRQLRRWKSLSGRCNTVLCVGDAYLLMHTLWGQGKKALLVATAKTKYINGHWKLESVLYRKGALKVWARDEATANELCEYGVNAVFDGNPIMDLQCDVNDREKLWQNGARILVLPGSRSRTYHDVQYVLGALAKIADNRAVSAVMVLAPSISPGKIVQSAPEWYFDGENLVRKNITVRLFMGDVTQVAAGAELLLGLAGTANQVCAGLGIPVLSILEKGKMVQKKLLGDAELLVEPTAEALSAAALRLLDDPCERARMSEAGKRRLGGAGALDAVVAYADQELGWGVKCKVYECLKRAVCERSTLKGVSRCENLR